MELRGIVKKYGEFVALRNLDLKVKRGEVFGVMGASGAGKTTLLRVMAAIEQQSSGDMYYDGRVVDERRRDYVRIKTTMVFQRTILFNTSVYKNIAYGLRLRGHPRGEINRQVRAILKMIGMDAYENKMAKKLSGGEQQRISLARALVLEPELLLLDEPTANLDPSNAANVEEAIKKIRGNTTVVFATHNLFQAKRLSDRLAFISDGILVEEGLSEDIFRNPGDRRTKDFINGKTVY